MTASFLKNLKKRLKMTNLSRKTLKRAIWKLLKSMSGIKYLISLKIISISKKLRKAIKLDRRLNIREIIEKIFGLIRDFKTKDELLEEEFEKFVSIYKPDSKYVLPIKLFLKAYITDNEVRDIVETKEFSRFATNPKVTMADFKELNSWRDIIPEYVKDYVSLNKYM